MKNSKAIQEKLARLTDGGQPRVLDLFAGCGGISLGFRATGFEVAGAVEYDPIAAASHGMNFHPGRPEHAEARDIIETSPADLARNLQFGPVGRSIDVLVGGPPCQAFARVGRSKLRQVQEHPQAFKRDPRAQLYLQYLEYVKAFAPLAVLMENVPDILNHGGQNVAEEVCEVLEGWGYIARYTILNTVHYGVPQMRQRMFLIAYHRDVSDTVTFPEPTHRYELPSGYEGSRQVALKLLSDVDLFGCTHRYMKPPRAREQLSSAISAEDAIGDLPSITLHLEGQLRRGARRFTNLVPYDDGKPMSEYARMMRSWSGFENDEGIYDHVIRYLPRDWKLFARMKSGDQYPEIHATAILMFESELRRRRELGERIREGSDTWRSLWAEYVPPYDPSKFPNKWWKLWRNEPVRTLMAHLGKDGYSHIHYDSAQCRTISVREAARLQSFPDGFIFKGTMNPAFRQIGNAVPPLMARALAREMLATLTRVEGDDEQENNRQAAVCV